MHVDQPTLDEALAAIDNYTTQRVIEELERLKQDQLLEKILDLKDSLGRTPTRREFAKRYNGYLGSVELTYGSWGEALKIIGLTAQVGGRYLYDKETLLTLLIDFKKRHGRNPMSSDCDRGLLPSRHTYSNYFGSWSKAKEEAKL